MAPWTTDSAAATIAVFSREKLKELLLQPRLGDEWKEYKSFMGPVWLENVLTHQPQRWLPPGYSSYDRLLAAAVEDAINDASATSAISLWKWGRVHRTDITHPFWSHVPVLKKGAGPGSLPLSAIPRRSSKVAPHFGPSERLTVDFADLDATTLDIVNGAVRQHLRRTLQRSVGRLLSRANVHAAVLARRRCSAQECIICGWNRKGTVAEWLVKSIAEATDVASGKSRINPPAQCRRARR